MARETKPEITKEKIGKNPFLSTLKVGVRKTPMHGTFKKDEEGIWLTAEVDLEADKYCRVYIDHEKRIQVINLSARAKELLLWMVYESESRTEWIWIHKSRYMREANITAHNTYKNAINELIKNRFIIASVIQHVYWINPEYFFNGSRIPVFPDNIVYK
jgi:hypothetical protein